MERTGGPLNGFRFIPFYWHVFCNKKQVNHSKKEGRKEGEVNWCRNVDGETHRFYLFLRETVSR
jgi:hypothetical protein